MTTEELKDLIPLDRKKYNVDRLVWESSVGAGYSTDLDMNVIHERLSAISDALRLAAVCVAVMLGDEDNDVDA